MGIITPLSEQLNKPLPNAIVLVTLEELSTFARRDDLVNAAGTNARALLVDGFGEGLLLEAPEQYFDFLRNTCFNLLQGCRMRNTKTFTARIKIRAKLELQETQPDWAPPSYA
ncbi:hypothetical protein LguiB_012901 [Lonicera macranthoides]